jgi:hypothetical protein
LWALFSLDEIKSRRKMIHMEATNIRRHASWIAMNIRRAPSI